MKPTTRRCALLFLAATFALARLAGMMEKLVVHPARMAANLESLGGVVHSGEVLLALTRAGEQLLNLISLCKEVLGEDEIKRQHKRWTERAMHEAGRLERVLAEVRVMVLEKKIKTTPARAAEDLWKRFK